MGCPLLPLMRPSGLSLGKHGNRPFFASVESKKGSYNKSEWKAHRSRYVCVGVFVLYVKGYYDPVTTILFPS